MVGDHLPQQRQALIGLLLAVVFDRRLDSRAFRQRRGLGHREIGLDRLRAALHVGQADWRR